MKDLWNKVKKFVKEKALPWLSKSWMQIINLMIVLFAYGKMDTHETPGAWLVGFWAFVLLAYYIFWKLFKVGEMIKGLKK